MAHYLPEGDCEYPHPGLGNVGPQLWVRNVGLVIFNLVDWLFKLIYLGKTLSPHLICVDVEALVYPVRQHEEDAAGFARRGQQLNSYYYIIFFHNKYFIYRPLVPPWFPTRGTFQRRRPTNNKNRLCSMTCGIDKKKLRGNTTKVSKIQMDPWKNSVAQSRRKRSHPKENSDQGATDPTPKRNLITGRRIPPRREIWSRNDGSHPEEKYEWEMR